MNEIATIPNVISLLRAPLALCLFSDSPTVRFVAIFIAMLTDFFDGWIARKFNQVSTTGITLDPIMDKLFISIALLIYFFESRITSVEVVAFLMRDISLLIFISWLWVNSKVHELYIQPIWSGKVTTTFQFVALILLSLNIHVPAAIYIIMAVFGVLSLPELFWNHYKKS